MFNKISTKLHDMKEQYVFQKEENARIARERIAEQKKIELERIQLQKEQWMSLSEKELLVEILIKLDAHNNQLDKLEKRHEDMENLLHSMEFKFYNIDSAINELSNR